MSIKYIIFTSGAALTLALSGALYAQSAADQANTAAKAQEQAYQAVDNADQQPSGTAEKFKNMKVDEATAADAKFHANRTEANMQARDQAEAEAAAAIDRVKSVDNTGQR